MIDTPNNCRVQAAFCRAQAANASLANVRSHHLASAEAWERLAAALEGGRRRQAPTIRVEAAVPDAQLRRAIIEARKARRDVSKPALRAASQRSAGRFLAKPKETP